MLAGVTLSDLQASAVPALDDPHRIVGIHAVDESGRTVLFYDDDPNGRANDYVSFWFDRLTGETIPLPFVLRASADLRTVVTLGDTERSPARWRDVKSGASAPLASLPGGDLAVPVSMSADGRLVLAGRPLERPSVRDGVAPEGAFVLSRDGVVDTAPLPNFAPARMSPNGRWVVLVDPGGANESGEYMLWDRATGSITELTAGRTPESIVLGVGDDGRVIFRQAVIGTLINGGITRVVRRALDGSVLELLPPYGDATTEAAPNGDASILVFKDERARVVTVDTATGVRADASSIEVFTGVMASTFGGAVIALIPPASGETNTADLVAMTVPGRGATPRVRANERMVVQVAGEGGVPAGAKAVVLNVTVTNPAGPGFATVWPCGSKPNASNVNFTAAGTTVANAVVAKLSASGTVCISPSTAAELVLDVQGYFTGSAYVGVVPDRVADSRDGESDVVPNLARRARFVVPVAGVGSAPADASAVVVNVTATNTAGPGYLTVWPCDESRPDASNVNFTAAGATVANAVVAKVADSGANDGSICVYTSVAADVIVDVQGYFTAGGYAGVVPDRFVDTRDGESDGTPNLGRRERLVVPVAGVRSVPEDASAVVVNVTVTNPEGPGFATVWPCDDKRPDASNVNFTGAGATVANAVVAKVADSGSLAGGICVSSSVAADVIVDVQGYFTGTEYAGVSPSRIYDTRG